MSYTIIDHGTWVPYTREAVVSPEGFPLVPAGTMFCRRESDGADWYDFSRAQDSFAAGSILIACLKTDIGWVTQGVFADFGRMFPQNQMLIELQGWEGEKPHNEFGMKIYDPVAQTFTDISVPAPQVIVFKKDIWVRATDAEADTIETVLSQQTTRKQRIFNEATYLDHADPFFAELKAGFIEAFGEERAGELLAES
ncbi:UNVERIFIED_ORG: hypothetical protein M2438_002481 [Methylobacterium sp. SuP10 SLI 274]|uniref:hypothetical protein n=1 Tax=Methylorubrum extorquens TaxID=408 RepID=UPI0020A16E22|nr:hypothetical protein [Methylorubrum extorquens]MDF9863704.1 hypothetical protein [Methylorubrum pseudosasae]MDH6637306.1 hypothetical protein [Methylobacterium sp. SuP10 SLI 274]MDH6666485.1 hypothetical protein [Methylorubrum zatmanii]MCP1558397.1 hypothetical protein [Methylorubrum extorquens]MDF9792016.1 hypothetical protein [Methylorubrum extorquens]